MNYLLRLSPYLKLYRKKLLLGFFVVVMSAVFTNAIPFVISSAIDQMKAQFTYTKLLDYAIITVVFALLSGIFLYFTRQTIIIVSREIENDLRNDFLKVILVQDQKYFHLHPTGEIMALATNDLSAVRNFLGPGIMYTSETMINLLLAASLMLSFSVKLTLIALIPVPLISYIVFRVGKAVNHKFELVQNQFAGLTTKVQENISGIKIIKAYVREKSETESFEKISSDYMRKNLSLSRVQSFAFPMMMLMIGVSVVIVLYFGGNLVIEGSLTLGELTAFIIYLGLLSWPIIALGWIVNLTQRANASMKRLCEVFDSKPVIKNPENIINPEAIYGEIEFKDVSFRYSEDLPYVLQNINLKITEGKTLGIIGHTGCGKTTLVNLILRLFETEQGSISIGGRIIKEYPLNLLRASIGYVPQETFLFSESIESNIAYGADKLDKDKVIVMSKISGIYKDVDSFPRRFETILGERGINLSGGQKQRVSIARALMINPRILILDDAFSAVDTYTEEEILKQLKSFSGQRTTILISHRVSTLKTADEIIVMKNGTIAESGTHEALIQQEGIYADIYFKQLLEEELDKL